MKNKTSPRSAFFYLRTATGVLLCTGGLALALFAFRTASAQKSPDAAPVQAIYKGISPVVHFDVSQPLRDTTPVDPTFTTRDQNLEERAIVPIRWRFAPEIDPVAQTEAPPVPLIPPPLVSFNAQSGTASPPDPNLAVGPNHIIGIANSLFQIFNKSGTSVFGPAANNTLWAGFGGGCQTRNDGDPVVVHDQLADRWLIMQFTTASPFLLCVAVSQTSDPTGAYYRWSIATGGGSNFADYPKASVWPDAYYFSTREFLGTGGPFQGVGAYALNRAQAIAGNPTAQVISFLATPSPAYNVGDGLLPADLDGPTLPPAGSPNYFVGSMDNNGPYGAPQDALTLWKFVANFANPPASSFVLTNTIPVASFNSILGLCGGTRACIPQQGSNTRLDHLGYRQRPTFRLAYRNFGTHESLVTNQSVSGGTGPNGEVSGIRWWELRSPNSSPFIFQEGTYAPGITDGIHRWMGSVAMNAAGDIGLGYSASGPNLFPSIYYTARNATSPLGQMTGGEGSIFTGTSAAAPAGNRWGDYTAIDVDPADDTTFWYINEYYAAPTTTWRLRIGSFQLPTVPVNSIVRGGAAIMSAGPNNTLDPGETVTVTLGLRNVNVGAPGSICTTAALTGTLQAGGGVTNPSGPQNYGAICTDAPVIYRQFTFTVDPTLPCGQTVTATLQVNDGAVNFGTVAFQFVTGSVGPTTNLPVENFDSVAAPALPAGWTPAASGSGTLPTTVTTFPDTAPNALFLSEAATQGISEVTSPTVNIPNGQARLNFRLEHNTEANWDGLLLEISINGGAFQDIETAGGVFESGGYTGLLNTSTSQPFPGRRAWSGLSGGTAAAPLYKSVIVRLPAAATGQSVQFKWRQGSDGSIAPTTNPGSRVDTITLSQTTLFCGGNNAPVATSALSRLVHGAAGQFDVALPLNVPLTGAIGIEPRSAVAGQYQIIVNFPNPVTVGGVVVNAGSGTASQSVAGNVVTINLTGVTDRQRLGLTLSNVSDGANIGSVQIPIGILGGDVNGNNNVNATDIAQVKSLVGAPVGPGNFRADAATNGTISASDIDLVKSKAGNTLP